MFDVGSCRLSRKMQLDEHSGKLRSVESLNVAGRSLREAEVGRGWQIDVPVLTVRWVNRQYVGSIWLLACTASRRWARCCNARAVCNSESLRGLHATLLERRGRSWCWQLGRVESSELVTKTEPYLSTTDQVNGRGNRG